jgi:membrane-associated phospholipid phosphatase
MKQRIARLITNVVNPFAVSAVVIGLLAFRDAPDIAHGVLWLAVSLALSVAPVSLAVLIMVRRRKMDGVFNNPRRQRYLLYGVAIAIGVVGFLVVWLGNGPRLLRLTFIAGVIALAVFMTVNFYWKISLHTAFIAGSATILAIVIGGWGALALVLLPAVGWSRWTLGQHSLAQVTAGAIGAAGIVTAVFAAGGYL